MKRTVPQNRADAAATKPYLYGGGKPEPVRAKDVTVGKIFRAACHRDGCGWAGAEHPAFAAASAERQAHLNWHILGEA